MIKKDIGPVSAYALAVEKGYVGSEEDFAVLQAESGNNAVAAAKSAEEAKAAAESVEALISEVSDDIAALADDVYYTESAEDRVTFLSPTRILENRYVYPVEDQGMLFLGYKEDGIYKTLEYKLEGGKTYTIKGSVSAFSAAYKYVYAVTETQVELPTETGWSTKIPYVHFERREIAGFATFEYIPQGDCWLYVNVYVNAGYDLDGSDSCSYTEMIPQYAPKTDLLKNLVGKNVAFMGDSIFGLNRTETNVPNTFKKLTGANVANLAFSGTRMVKRAQSTEWGKVFGTFDAENLVDYVVSGDYSELYTALANPSVTDVPSYYADVVADLAAYDFSTCDILVCNWATNDYSIGTSLEAYKAAFKSFAKKLLAAYPNIILVKCTPTQRFFNSISADGHLQEKEDAERIDEYYSGDVIAWRGAENPTLDEYAEVDFELAKVLNIRVIDLHNIGINYYTRPRYFDGSDTTHQNANGRKLIAETLANEIL